VRRRPAGVPSNRGPRGHDRSRRVPRRTGIGLHHGSEPARERGGGVPMTDEAGAAAGSSFATDDVRHRYLVAGGLRLHLVQFAGEGRPTVCLHGVTGNGFAWSRVAERLAGSARVLGLDLRGHGDSQWSGSGAYTTEDHAADLEAVVESVGGTVNLVG